MSGPFVQFEDVAVQRGGQAVLDVPSFAAQEGRITVLSGENGAGKTTMLLAAAGLIDLAGGEVRLFGEPYHSGRAPAPRRLRRRVAIVFQEPYLFRRSVRANLEYALKLRGVVRAERARRSEEALASLGIAQMAQRKATELSGGERKLVALGRALVLRPRALLLDEMTASLDDQARETVLDLLQSIVSEQGTSVLMATHVEGLSERLQAAAFPLCSGRLVRS